MAIEKAQLKSIYPSDDLIWQWACEWKDGKREECTEFSVFFAKKSAEHAARACAELAFKYHGFDASTRILSLIHAKKESSNEHD